MKGRTIFVLGLALATLLILSAGMVSAAAGDSYYTATPLSSEMGPMTGTLAPGQSTWYKFTVADEYSWTQYRNDQREGHPIVNKVLHLDYSDASNPNVAHNVGFYIYDPYRADLLMKGIVLEPYTNEHGVKVDPVGYWGMSSPAIPAMSSKERAAAESTDLTVGLPKVWEGVTNDAGTYYVEVFNTSSEPVNYTLTMGTQIVQCDPQ